MRRIASRLRVPDDAADPEAGTNDVPGSAARVVKKYEDRCGCSQERSCD